MVEQWGSGAASGDRAVDVGLLHRMGLLKRISDVVIRARTLQGDQIHQMTVGERNTIALLKKLKIDV